MPSTREDAEALSPFRYTKATGTVNGRWCIIETWTLKFGHHWSYGKPGSNRVKWRPVRWWWPGDLIFFAADRWRVHKLF